MPAKPNGFFLFMKEYRDKNFDRAVPYSEVTEVAGKLWKEMPSEAREKYNSDAKQAPRCAKKYTSLGEPIAFIEKEEEQKKQYEYEMLENIRNTVRNARHEIQNKNFYILHINYFCYVSGENQYYPAEIALSRFNLQNGVTEKDTYHAMCKPGRLPLGYAAIAQKESDETHQVNPPSSYSYSDNYNLNWIFSDIIQFLAVDSKPKSNELPPLYVLPKNFDVAFKVMGHLCDEFEFPRKNLKVYALQHLFLELRNAVHGRICFPSVSLATAEIENDFYEYATKIGCEMHQVSTVEHYCSLSVVVRMAYVLCNNCCGDLGIELIPGKHIPSTSVPVKVKENDKEQSQELNSMIEECDKFSTVSSRFSSKTPSLSSICDNFDRSSFLSTYGSTITLDEVGGAVSRRLRNLNLPKNECMDGDRAGPGAYGTEELESRESSFRVSEVSDNDSKFRLPYGKFNSNGKKDVSDTDTISELDSDIGAGIKLKQAVGQGCKRL